MFPITWTATFLSGCFYRKGIGKICCPEWIWRDVRWMWKSYGMDRGTVSSGAFGEAYKTRLYCKKWEGDNPLVWWKKFPDLHAALPDSTGFMLELHFSRAGNVYGLHLPAKKLQISCLEHFLGVNCFVETAALWLEK